jgi:ferredoxin
MQRRSRKPLNLNFIEVDICAEIVWESGDSACVGCRKCEEHCPQQIRIADELAVLAYITRSDQLPGQGENRIQLTIKDRILLSRWRNEWFPDVIRRLKLLKGIWRAASRYLPIKGSHDDT